MDPKLLTEHFYIAFTTWREARGEPYDAKVAVARSITTRAAHPRWWGRSVDEVCVKAYQYSSLTDPNDPQLAKAWPKIKDTSWLECVGVAWDVMNGAAPNPFPQGTHYHDTSLPGPPSAWGANPRFLGQIGRLKFYNPEGI